MELKVEAVDVWAAGIPDTPGGLSGTLTALREAGADLGFVIARRSPEAPGKGVVFVTPLQGDKQLAAAAQIGFNVTQTLHCVKVMGKDSPGIGARLTEALAGGGINLRGFSAAALAGQFVAYVALDSEQDADKAAAILKRQ
jgi:hypothetical protein